jgi:hypothetical protein
MEVEFGVEGLERDGVLKPAVKLTDPGVCALGKALHANNVAAMSKARADEKK